MAISESEIQQIANPDNPGERTIIEQAVSDGGAGGDGDSTSTVTVEETSSTETIGPSSDQAIQSFADRIGQTEAPGDTEEASERAGAGSRDIVDTTAEKEVSDALSEATGTDVQATDLVAAFGGGTREDVEDTGEQTVGVTTVSSDGGGGGSSDPDPDPDDDNTTTEKARNVARNAGETITETVGGGGPEVTPTITGDDDDDDGGLVDALLSSTGLALVSAVVTIVTAVGIALALLLGD